MGCLCFKNIESSYTDNKELQITTTTLPNVKTIDISPRLKQGMEYIIRNLDAIKDFEPPKFKPFDFSGIVVRVKDGDTVVVNGVLVNERKENIPCQYHIRLARVDAPELKSKNPEEAKKALEVKNKLVEYILNKPVITTIVKPDKYSNRFVGELNSKQIGNVSDWLLENHYAVPYNGGKKLTFDFNYYNPPVNKTPSITAVRIIQ